MRYHFIRDLVQRGALKWQHIRASEQIANILTKPLSASKFLYFRDKLRMAENASLAERECWFFLVASRAIHFGEWGHLVRDHDVDSTQCWVTVLLNGRYLVLDHDMDPALPWGNSTLCWVTIPLNGRHLVRDHDVDQSSIGRLSLDLSSHSFEWRHLVSYQDSARGWEPFSWRIKTLGLLPSIWPSVKLCSLWLTHLV